MSPPASIAGPPSGSRTSRVWPTGARCRRTNGQQLAGAHPFAEVHAMPLPCHQDQRSPVRAAEHAGEAAAVDVDRLQYLSTFPDAHAVLVSDVRVPGGALRVQADAVR